MKLFVVFKKCQFQFKEEKKLRTSLPSQLTVRSTSVAIKLDFDKVKLSKLNAMLGEVRAIPIDEYIVMYNPAHKDILVTRIA